MQVTTPRSVIRPADPLLFLIPQDRPLVIAAQVLPTNVDEITVGQEVNLRLSSLDQRTTPELKGQVVLISADALDDPATGQSYFGVEITLSAGEAERLPEGTQLLPGMPVDAFIKTGDRTPLTYLVKPLTDYFVK
jgi:HlyD family secretion protein